MMIAIDLSKKQALDADPKQYSKSMLFQLKIKQDKQQCILLLKKPKKLF